MNRGASYFKALKVIDSCTSEDHFDATRNYLDNFFNVYIKNANNYLDHKAALELFEVLIDKFHSKLNKIIK